MPAGLIGNRPNGTEAEDFAEFELEVQRFGGIAKQNKAQNEKVAPPVHLHETDLCDMHGALLRRSA